MPPEEPEAVVAAQLDFVKGVLQCRGERVFPVHGSLKASWYTASKARPNDYVPILGGVVYVHKPSMADCVQFEDLYLTKVGNQYKWRDNAREDGLMFALIFPQHYGIAKPKPMPIEAKKLDERLALFWLLYPLGKDSSSVVVEWELDRLTDDVDREVERVNRQILLASKREETTEYDVALSFAGEDRVYVGEVARALKAIGITVFYDEFEQANLWGKSLVTHLDNIYRKRARYTVMFISKSYAEKRWPSYEREIAQARAFADNREYILPARFDDTELPGMLPTTAYVPLNAKSPAELVRIIVEKLEATSK
jgi:hypothetical protein